ncbi:MAG: BrnA antitoxin family protein [Thermodesulfobacteriota bacterium]
MKRKPNPELVDRDNPEWTDQDFRVALRAADSLADIYGPEVASEMVRPRGRPKAAVTKAHVNIRLDADVLEAFKAGGRGWQTRLNRALREWLRENSQE